MDNRLFTDHAFASLNHHAEHICGDSFLLREKSGGRRTFAVLSDGMGHGVRANILSTFTSTMLMNFLSSYDDIGSIGATVLDMLPVNPAVDTSYSTFTIADIDNVTESVSLAQYDNPPTMLLRNGAPVPLEWEERTADKKCGRPVVLRTTQFTLQEGDRLVMVSDGITQSGQRDGAYKFGWGQGQLEQFVSYLTSVNTGMSSADLAAQIVSKANINDGMRPADDMSCAAFYFRRPKRMTLVSCPPSLEEDNPRLVSLVKESEGEKAVCGYPVAKILASGLGIPLRKSERPEDPIDEPAYTLPGFELVTEGMVVPNRVLDLLEHASEGMTDSGVAGRLYKMFMRHDEIHFVIGLRRNSDADANLPDEFQLRRNILRQIAALLQSGFGKKVRITFI